MSASEYPVSEEAADPSWSVSKTRLDLPEPDTPVTTVSARCGTSQRISRRLWVRAPSMRIGGFRTISRGLLDARARSGSRHGGGKVA